jgi:hypothetical protein
VGIYDGLENKKRRIILKNGTIRKKGEIMMGIEIDWTLVVLIGILVCLGYLTLFMMNWEDASRRNMNKIYKYLEEIREKQ